LKLANFSVIVTDSKSNIKLNATHFGHTTDASLEPIKEFLVEPNVCYKLRFSGEQYQFMENAEVQVRVQAKIYETAVTKMVCFQFLRLEIQMGSERHVAILTQSSTLNKVKPFKTVGMAKDNLDDLKLINSCYIIPT
jgi:hypothetical protein